MLGRAAAYADAAGDGVVARCKSASGNGGAAGASRDAAAGRVPGVERQRLFALVEIDGPAGDGNGVARKDRHWLQLASVGGRHRRHQLAKAKYDARAQPECGDLTLAAGVRVCGDLPAVVDVRVVEVALNGPNGDAISQCSCRQDVINAEASGHGPPPVAGVRRSAVVIRWTNLRAAANYVCEGNEAANLMAVDGTGLHGREAVVRIVEELAVFGLYAERVIEVSGDTGDEAAWKGSILLTINVAVDGMKLAISAVDIESRWAGQARARRCRLGRADKRNNRGGEHQKKGFVSL